MTVVRGAERLGDSDEVFRRLVGGIADRAVVMLDTAGRIVTWHAGAERLTGYSAAEVLGEPFDVLFPAEDVGTRRAAELLAEAARAGYAVDEGWHVRRDGGRFQAETAVTAPRDDGDAFPGFAMVITDVGERQAAQDRLLFESRHDSLTGLASREEFRHQLVQVLDALRARDDDAGGVVAVLLVDLDRFGAVNDARGHAVGDGVLVEVARRLSGLGRAGDVVARLGGDEFALLVTGLEHAREAGRLADRVLDALRPPVSLTTDPVAGSREQVTVRASVGVAIVADSEVGPDTVLHEADAALCRAKERGRGRFELVDRALRAEATERLEVESGLREALDYNRLLLHVQPVVSLGTGDVESVEALLRWDRPGVGLEHPLAFLDVAERSGLLPAIADWVLLAGTALAASWLQRLGPRSPVVALNVSSAILARHDFVTRVTGALTAARLRPERLRLEVPASTVASDGPPLRTLHELHDLGVAVAIDDFGAGSLSLARLRHLPVDVLKIDRALVAGIGRDPRDDAVVRAVLTLAEVHGLDTVAQGVENREQADRLAELGCDRGQGFALWPPRPPEEIERALREQAVLDLGARQQWPQIDLPRTTALP